MMYVDSTTPEKCLDVTRSKRIVNVSPQVKKRYKLVKQFFLFLYNVKYKIK